MLDNVMIIRTGIGLIVEGLRKNISQKVSYKQRPRGWGERVSLGSRECAEAGEKSVDKGPART